MPRPFRRVARLPLKLLPHRFVRRHSRPGTAPGTLAPPEQPRTETVSITVTRYDGESCEERTAGSFAELEPLLPKALPDAASPTTDPLGDPPGDPPAKSEPGVTWIDVTGIHDVELVAAVGRHFGLHPLALEDVVNAGQRPKVEDYEGHLFLILRHFHRQDHELVPEQISLFALPGVVLTFQEVPGDAFDPVRERLRRGSGRIRSRGSDYLTYALIDALVDRFFPLLEALGERIEDLEEELIHDPSQSSVDHIYRLRRDLLLLRRTSWPKRELIHSLQRGDSHLVSDETRIFLRDCYDHAVEVMEIIETYRELAAGMLDVYLSSVSQRMNEVMKVLTIIATLFIPLTFIAGVYGMNFEYMPELTWHWGYPASLGLMAVIAVGLLYYFRRKDWL